MTISAKLLENDVLVGVDADAPCDDHTSLRDLARAQFRVLQQSRRGRFSEWTARPDGRYVFIGIDNVAGPADDERALQVGDKQKSLEMAQHSVGSPLLC